MKKVYIALSMAAAVALSGAAQTKFDSYSLGAVNFYKQLKAEPGANHITPVEIPFDMTEYARSGEATASVLIKFAPGYTVDDLIASGLEISSVIGDGDMCVADGSMDDIIALENVGAVQSLSIGAPVRPLLDRARSKSGVEDVHKGTGLSRSYNGKGVVCGIFDSGVDPNHINFYDSEFKESRVKQVHNFVGQSTSPISYTDPQAIAKFTTDSKQDTHGTHTMGCMTGAFMLAGNKAGNTYPTGQCAVMTNTGGITVLASTKNPYYGTAPGADIVVGCGSLTNNQTIAAVQKVVDYAVANNQPAVMNLSLGNNQGSHDGLDNFGQAMSRLSKNAIICISSGNEGDYNISIIKNLTASDNVLRTCLNLPTGSSTGILDIYGSDKNPFTLGVAVINKKTGQVLVEKEFNTEGTHIFGTNNYTQSGTVHDQNFDNAFTSSYVQAVISDNAGTSGRRGITMSYSLKFNSATNASNDMILAIFCKGTAGQRIDIVNNVVSGKSELASNNLAGYSNATPDLTVNNLACSNDVIAVGAWTTRTTWPTISRGTWYFGDNSPIKEDRVSPFTSYGTLYDGRELPDICAPGAGIVSSISSYYTELTDPKAESKDCVARYTYNGRNYTFDQESGTSMASPFCAGVIATWLEADPTLTVARVKEILKKTADPLDGPAVQRGPGRLNAYNGLKEVLNGTGSVGSVRVEDEILVKSNGSSYEVFVPGGQVSVTVYNLNGQPVKQAHTGNSTLDLDLSSLGKGIYLLNVNGVHTERIALN